MSRQQPETKPPLPTWRKVLICIIAVVVLLLAASYIGRLVLSGSISKSLGEELSRIASSGEPIALQDIFSRQGGLQSGDISIKITSEQLGQLANYVATYRQAVCGLPKTAVPQNLVDSAEKILKDSGNQLVLQRCYQGFGSPYDFDSGIESGISKCIENISRVRTAFYLLSLQTLRSLCNGNSDSATDSVVVSMATCSLFDSQPLMVVFAAANSCLMETVKDALLVVQSGRCSESSLIKLQKILRLSEKPDALSKMFIAERVYRIETIRTLVPEDAVSKFLSDPAPVIPERLGATSAWSRLRQQQAALRYLRDTAEYIDSAKQPWPGPLDTIVGENSLVELPGNRLAHRSNAAKLTLTAANTAASLRTLRVAVAIERYRLSTGGIPASLGELAPSFIPELPSDPFTGQSLLYKPTDRSYSVYSVGRNRTDDGADIRSLEPPAAQKGQSPKDIGCTINLQTN